MQKAASRASVASGTGIERNRPMTPAPKTSERIAAEAEYQKARAEAIAAHATPAFSAALQALNTAKFELLKIRVHEGHGPL